MGEEAAVGLQPMRDLLLEINPCRGTVRIDLLDEEEEDQFLFTPDIVDVESLSEVERYQCFTFPEESCYDLKIDKISMKKTPRDDSAEGRRWEYLSDEACELGPQIYTLKITTANESWHDVDNVQATIVFSGNTTEDMEELSDDELSPEEDSDVVEDEEREEGSQDRSVLEADSAAPEDEVTEDDVTEDDVTEDDVTEDQSVSDDFVLEATDEFLLHNLKNIGKVECIFVTMATDEIWQFHEIRVTRVKREEKPVVSTKEAQFKPVARLYARRTSQMFSSYLNK